MKAYHFAALTAIMGLSFLAGGLATVLARQRVESWYEMFSRPEKVPPPPAYGWGWRSIYVLLGAAAWLIWLAGPQWGAPWVRLGMVLYFVLLGLNVLWSGLFYRLARPRAAFAAVLAQGLVTLAALVVFWNISILPGALLIPVVAWTGFVAIRNLAWWRHGRQLGPLGAQAAMPPPGLVA
ncbi:MAG TPA: TspO/MBR family protein [Terriglobales bacterium]|nr:TspO/MBR family protein [Terriglobales bacterium]